MSTLNDKLDLLICLVCLTIFLLLINAVAKLVLSRILAKGKQKELAELEDVTQAKLDAIHYKHKYVEAEYKNACDEFSSVVEGFFAGKITKEEAKEQFQLVYQIFSDTFKENRIDDRQDMLDELYARRLTTLSEL